MIAPLQAEETLGILPYDNVAWQPLNPKRGDQSPQAGMLWGDITKTGPSGFLVKFRDGFSSPPHIHNVSYRGVVISGLIHNDDHGAANMWMPQGSFWTQPAGEAHITAAKGSNNIAYIEIDDGPYLVEHIDHAFDNGERPVNVDPANMVWLDASSIAWMDKVDSGVKTAFLWGSPDHKEPYGSLIKLPKGFTGQIQHNGDIFHAVVIQGSITPLSDTSNGSAKLVTGSYVGTSGKATTILHARSEEDTIIYIRTNNIYHIHSTEE